MCMGVFVAGVLGVLVVTLLGGETSSQQFLLVALGVYGTVGYVVAPRAPRNAVPWLMLAAAGIAGIFGLCQSVASLAVLRDAFDSWWNVLACWPTNWLWMPLVTVSTTLPVLLFPDGHLLSRRWRLVAVSAVVITVLYVVPNALAWEIGTAVSTSSLRNPLSPPFMARFGTLDNSAYNNTLLLAAAVTLVFAAVSVTLRWRRAVGVERVQLRWLQLGATGLTVGVVLNFAVPAPWGSYLLMCGFALLPVCMGVAILRYRLYEIDRLISRTVSYGCVTFVVLAMYAGVVTLVSSALPDKESALPIAVATLAAAAAFRPLLRRVQARVDRRFNRERYDAARVVEEFGARLRDQVDAEATESELLDVVDRTVAPGGASLWVSRGVLTPTGDTR